MAVASEVSVTNLTAPARALPSPSLGSLLDANLVLRSAEDITATGNGTPITCEGGFFAEFCILVDGAASGTSPTLDTFLEVSIDNGSNYFVLLQMPRLDESDDNDFVIARAVYIPRPNSSQRTVLVRARVTIGGSATPTFNDVTMWLRPPATGTSQGMEVLT